MLVLNCTKTNVIKSHFPTVDLGNDFPKVRSASAAVDWLCQWQDIDEWIIFVNNKYFYDIDKSIQRHLVFYFVHSQVKCIKFV